MVVHRTESVVVDRGDSHPGSTPTTALVQVTAVGAFEGTLRDSVTALKYAGRRDAARSIAELLAPLVPDGADVVTWIPTAPSRVRRRGFDHAEAIARCTARTAGVRCRRLLRRTDESQQTGGGKSARSRGPALVASRACRGRTVVLVDDVVTTGATVRAAARAVLGAGAVRIVCLCAATVQ